jgi:hypothetical protein
VLIRHDTSTLTNLWASGRIFGIGGNDDVTFGLISFNTFPWLVFILLGMCFVRLARANLSFLSSAEVVLEAFATAVVAAGRSGEGEDDLLEDSDDEEDEEDEDEDELEIVLFRLVDTAISLSISSNSS